MKIRKILNESYYDGLYHLSENKNLTISNMENIDEVEKHLPDKPRGGLWLAKGLSWLRWGVENDFFGDIESLYLYRVKINPKARIMDLRETSTDIWLEPEGRKNQKFKEKNDPLGRIDFTKVAKEFDGVRAYNFISSTYSIPSVVIFNKNVIQSIDYVDSAINIVRKM
jgi:hypothetical protein